MNDVIRAAGQDTGCTLIEVMIAMVILAFSILGVMAMFQWGEHGLHDGGQRMRALALAEARVEAKRAAPWTALLLDDVDLDGRADIVMSDDGRQGDEAPGDGIYTATTERDGIRLVWTVQPLPHGPLPMAGLALIKTQASYQAGGQWHAVSLGALRANPYFIGLR